MTFTVKLEIPFQSLVEAIASLNLEEKRQLQEVLEQQIFELEEATYEDDAETVKEIEVIRDEYTAGEYQTLDEFLLSRSE
jgi:hypothetical protein